MAMNNSTMRLEGYARARGLWITVDYWDGGYVITILSPEEVQVWAGRSMREAREEIERLVARAKMEGR